MNMSTQIQIININEKKTISPIINTTHTNINRKNLKPVIEIEIYYNFEGDSMVLDPPTVTKIIKHIMLQAEFCQ